ncbi:MAG: hypothetical protein LBE41_12595, partial [Staphylococcus saprophyticus]|nr:hypothetical protein [Staphylococcus saprophyticus]
KGKWSYLYRAIDAEGHTLTPAFKSSIFLKSKLLSSRKWPDYRTTLLPELSPLIEINNND